MDETPMSIETFLKADKMMCIFRSAVRKAQAESRRLGVANAYTINGQRYFELPNGDFTRTRPKTYGKNGG